MSFATRTELTRRLSDQARLARLIPTLSDRAREAMAHPDAMRDAAVLVPIIWHDAGPSILLTLRASGLSSHAGQVAFPGGRLEPGESAAAAALREAAEEVGLDPALAQIAGHLPLHFTGTGYRVTPVVAFLDPPLTLTPEPSEVAAIFELPLATVLDPAAPTLRQVELHGRQREFWVWPHPEHLIWGATAAMLVTLAQLLRE